MAKQKDMANEPSTKSLYVSYDQDLQPWCISIRGNGDEGFKAFLYNRMREVKPGLPLPNIFYVHYEYPDIPKFRKITHKDLKEVLIKSLQNLGIGLPAHIIHLSELMYSVQKDIPVLSAQATRQSERLDYFDKCNEIRRCAPNLSAKLDILQVCRKETPPKARHVPSLPVKPHRQGPTV